MVTSSVIQGSGVGSLTLYGGLEASAVIKDYLITEKVGEQQGLASLDKLGRE